MIFTSFSAELTDTNYYRKLKFDSRIEENTPSIKSQILPINILLSI